MDLPNQYRTGRDKLQDDYQDSVKILRDCVSFCNQGAMHYYRSIAVELRKLLCDAKNSNGGLLQELFSNEGFHPIQRSLTDLPRPDSPPETEDSKWILTFALSGEILLSRPGIVRIFDESKPKIPVSEWLEQPIAFLGPEEDAGFVTIRNLIKAVADKEGAHADKTLGPVLRLTQPFKINAGRGVVSLHKEYIIGIGEYVLGQLNPLNARVIPETEQGMRISAVWLLVTRVPNEDHETNDTTKVPI